jgi:hypothetical protein
LQFVGGEAGTVLVADQDQHRHAAPVIDRHGDAYRIDEAEARQVFAQGRMVLAGNAWIVDVLPLCAQRAGQQQRAERVEVLHPAPASERRGRIGDAVEMRIDISRPVDEGCHQRAGIEGQAGAQPGEGGGGKIRAGQGARLAVKTGELRGAGQGSAGHGASRQ